MKTFKLIQIAVVTLVLSVLVGCSDQFTSPTSGGESISQSEDLLAVSAFSSQIVLKPYKSYVFDISNTGFRKITSIDINAQPDPGSDQMFLDCQNISVRSNPKYDQSLGCHSSGINVKSITVENLSSSFITMDVTLTGVRPNRSVYEKE